MAKVDTQSIPSEDRINYKRACQISTRIFETDYVRKRFPWRIPKMQKGGYGVSPGQEVQRDRFDIVKGKYALLSTAEKQRWVDANPPWGSVLFGYNFFMLEGLKGGGTLEYPQMIKSIQVVKEAVPATGTKSFAIETVDPAKTVVMIHGNSYIADTVHTGQNTVNQNDFTDCDLIPSVDPAISEIILQGEVGAMSLVNGTGDGDWGAPFVNFIEPSYFRVRLPASSEYALCRFSWQVIEHKAQTVYPVLVSIAANAVVIDWAVVPSVAGDVSITVVEYL